MRQKILEGGPHIKYEYLIFHIFILIHHFHSIAQLHLDFSLFKYLHSRSSVTTNRFRRCINVPHLGDIELLDLLLVLFELLTAVFRFKKYLFLF
jgi:hypothetical protein